MPGDSPSPTDASSPTDTTYSNSSSEKAHLFEPHTWTKPKLVYCLVCGKPLWGVYHQGLKCSACTRAVHVGCRPKAGLCSTLYDPFFLGSSDPVIKPLFVFVNPKSGGQQGKALMQSAAEFLGEAQVFDLSLGGPAPHLRQLGGDAGAYPDCQLLVCGGDGTVGWVLSAMDELRFANEPPVAVLPLGTGNDLSRALGWGPGYQLQKFRRVLDRLFLGVPSMAVLQMLDRWLVRCAGQRDRRMANYFSIGVDASIALAFHEAREKNPEQFKSRDLNKWTYLKCAVDALSPTADLSLHLSVTADGRPVPLPRSAAGLIVLNVTSYGAGADLWGTPAHFRPQSYGDILLEVCTVTGVAHLAAVQAKTSTGDPLCQCRTLTIAVTKAYPMQVDGEPWLQPPTLVEVAFDRQSRMLRYNPPLR